MIRTTLAAAALCALTVAGQANAALLVDRGLPVDNLNNAAGANRSNVAWAFANYTSDDYWMVGDTFTNNTTGNWKINTVRLWTVGTTDSAVLRGGLAGDAVGVISGTTYGDGITSTYQGSGGGMSDMFQVDFVLNILLGAGQTFNFFLDGAGSATAGQGTSIPFVHASNAALSGSPQDGADNQMLYAQVVGGIADYGTVGTWTSLGNSWDKASDVNVQVFGNAVPEPGSLALVGLALGGLAFARKRKTAK